MNWKYPDKPRIFIEHIFQCIEDIKKYTNGIDKNYFLTNKEKQDAVVRKIEIIGEAVKNLPLLIRKNHPDVPWKEIAGMRDILIHEYFDVDLNYAWTVVEVELPKLERNIKKILQEIKE